MSTKTISIITTVFEENNEEQTRYYIVCSDLSTCDINITTNEFNFDNCSEDDDDNDYENHDPVEIIYDMFDSMPPFKYGYYMHSTQVLSVCFNKNVPKELTDFANNNSYDFLKKLLSYPVVYKQTFKNK